MITNIQTIAFYKTSQSSYSQPQCLSVCFSDVPAFQVYLAHLCSYRLYSSPFKVRVITQIGNPKDKRSLTGLQCQQAIEQLSLFSKKNRNQISSTNNTTAASKYNWRFCNFPLQSNHHTIELVLLLCFDLLATYFLPYIAVSLPSKRLNFYRSTFFSLALGLNFMQSGWSVSSSKDARCANNHLLRP